MFQDEVFGLPLQKLSYIRDKCLDILEMFKEKHEALLKVLRDSLVLATAELQRRLQAFRQFRSYVKPPVNMNDSWTCSTLLRETPGPKKNSRTALFRACTKTKVLLFIILICVLVSLMENWERKSYPYCGFPRYTFNRLVANI